MAKSNWQAAFGLRLWAAVARLSAGGKRRWKGEARPGGWENARNRPLTRQQGWQIREVGKGSVPLFHPRQRVGVERV